MPAASKVTAALLAVLLLSACSSSQMISEPPQMQDRLNQLMQPDSLIRARPEGATLISGQRVSSGGFLNEDFSSLESDDFYFTWANDEDEAGAPDLYYTDFSRVVNGVKVGRSGNNGVDGRSIRVADTMPEWVRLEFAAFEPVVEATGMGVVEWKATVYPDWQQGLTTSGYGRSTVNVRLGFATSRLLDGPGNGVFQTLKELGEVIGAQGQFDDVTFTPESQYSGTFTYEIGGRVMRYYSVAGPTLRDSMATFTIEETQSSGT